LTNGPDEEQELKQERLVQLTEETKEAAETKRNLEAEVKRAQVSTVGWAGGGDFCCTLCCPVIQMSLHHLR